MIHELVAELNSRMAARGVPVKAFEGPEGHTSVAFRDRIVIERDGSDSFGNVRGTHSKTPHYFTRNVGCKATIYAQAPAANARPFEHYRRAEHILDLFLVQMSDVLAVRRNDFSPGNGQFVALDDQKDSDLPVGAKYELAFTVSRAVRWQDWDSSGRPTGALGGVRSTTKVGMHGNDDDGNPATPPLDAETACG